VNTFGKIATFNNSRRKKKRRRIEIICNLHIEILNNENFFGKKVYTMISKNNLEMLILNNRKKEKKVEKTLLIQTQSEEEIF
jgi:hypothetical protein